MSEINSQNRSKIIIRTSLIGTLINIGLVVLKSIVGLVTNSIALILDAVNNLGDAFSSVITILGTKLSGKKPDSKHPFGYGRIEYFTSFIIGVFVLIAGITAMKEAVGKIITPEDANYSVVSIILIGIAVGVKLFTGLFVRATGKKINAKTLEDSGLDALMDSIVSFTTLVGALLNMIFGLRLEGWLGAVISLLVLKSAYEILSDTISTLLGTHGDIELVQQLKKKISSYDDVKGAYDLVLHNYGPSKSIGTIHIEVQDNLPGKRIHEITRKIQDDIYKEYGIIMTVGIYASNNSDSFSKEMHNTIAKVIKETEHVSNYHGLYINEEKKIINFDVVINFSSKNMEATKNEVASKMKEFYPDYDFNLQFDINYNSQK